jgi:hypothetical protein
MFLFLIRMQNGWPDSGIFVSDHYTSAHTKQTAFHMNACTIHDRASIFMHVDLIESADHPIYLVVSTFDRASKGLVFQFILHLTTKPAAKSSIHKNAYTILDNHE